MYRIVFNTEKCVWEIQISKFHGLYWATLKNKKFDNLDEATAFVKQTGIDKVYRNYAGSAMQAVTQGTQHQMHLPYSTSYNGPFQPRES